MSDGVHIKHALDRGQTALVPLLRHIQNHSAFFLVAGILLLAVVLTLALTRLRTSLQYRRGIRQLRQISAKGTRVIEPIQIPYTIPWIGNGPFLFNRNPGQSWASLFQWHPRETGVLTLLVNGRRVQFVYSATAVQAMLKSRAVVKTTFEDDFLSKAFDMPPDQIDLCHVHKATEESINANYLTSFERVCELTSTFLRMLGEEMDAQSPQSSSFNLYGWLRNLLFEASVRTLAGDRLLKLYPGWTEDFWCFENEFGNFMIDMPAFMNQTAIKRRERMFARLQQWSDEGHVESDRAMDPEDCAWEPVFGSRLERAMQRLYRDGQFTRRSGAGFDASLMFGLASNAIPVTGWMLFHILAPSGPPLLPLVMAEIEQSQNSDGSLNILKLIAQPLLQSIWHECLRLYSDVMIGRTLIEDTVFPLDAEETTHVRLRKGDQLYIPSYVLHHDPSWTVNGVAGDSFDPKRFYRSVGENRATFVLNNAAGRFLPFGGGKTICPGRVFAKQLTIGAVASILLKYTFQPVGYIDGRGRATAFPRFRKAYIGSGALSPEGDLKVRVISSRAAEDAHRRDIEQ